MKRKTNIKPKPYGHEAINIICKNCGKMFSEREGHICGD